MLLEQCGLGNNASMSSPEKGILNNVKQISTDNSILSSELFHMIYPFYLIHLFRLTHLLHLFHLILLFRLIRLIQGAEISFIHGLGKGRWTGGRF